MLLIHYQYLPSGALGFVTSKATVTTFPDSDAGNVVRLDISQPQQAWKIGQHFYLCFSALSVWQSHPFTPLNLPITDGKGALKHSYIVRAKKGLTAKLCGLSTPITPVIMQGAYGENLVEHLTPDVNVLAIAGGTGITYVLPVLLWLADRSPARNRRVALIWAVRHMKDIEWVRPEMESLTRCAQSHGIEVHVHVTRDIPASQEKTMGAEVTAVGDSGLDSDSSVASERHPPTLRQSTGRPDLAKDVADFVEGTVRGRTEIFASGPGSLVSELRSTVASLNRPTAVWRGQERFDVGMHCDDRLEW